MCCGSFVVQKLIASKAHDHEGFAVLTSLVQAHSSGLPLPMWEAQLPTCWGLMFTRLQGSRTPKVGTWKGIGDGWPRNG